ncbi:MAG: caspase family protein [Planctomycetaceae bacterium]|jgi:hypothetical protein|nr:caspase family protein [Planctomycetaceae bacterium]
MVTYSNPVIPGRRAAYCGAHRQEVEQGVRKNRNRKVAAVLMSVFSPIRVLTRVRFFLSVYICLSVFTAAAAAQELGANDTRNKYALLIGINEYQDNDVFVPLKAPGNDAAGLKEQFEALGFVGTDIMTSASGGGFPHCSTGYAGFCR